MSERGWTIRVFSTVAKGGSVQVMNRPTASNSVRIPALSHLNRYLPDAPQAVAAYAAFMRELGVDITKLGSHKHMPIDEEKLRTHVDHLARCIRSLALAYGGVTPGISTV
jgi:hypothetical protein